MTQFVLHDKPSINRLNQQVICRCAVKADPPIDEQNARTDRCHIARPSRGLVCQVVILSFGFCFVQIAERKKIAQLPSWYPLPAVKMRYRHAEPKTATYPKGQPWFAVSSDCGNFGYATLLPCQPLRRALSGSSDCSDGTSERTSLRMSSTPTGLPSLITR